MSRLIEVAPERLERWLDGFAERHGGATTERAGAAVRASGADGAVAEGERFDHDPLGLLLVRRGGYAVGLARGAALAEHKTGTRYVQSRTAAGGWSQQRFARRRGNQADELVRSVAVHALRILPRGLPAGLVLGGDRALAAQTLADPRLGHLAELPRRELYDLPDPRLDVLRDALKRGRSVRITLTEPSADPAQDSV